MSPSTRTSGVGMMYAGGAMQALALLLIAFAQEPFPIALILIAGGLLLFFAGAVLSDRRSDAARLGYRPPEFFDEF
ncbi:MAG: hypothetical protein WBP49_05750 [Acidimicrobiia bacterium]